MRRTPEFNEHVYSQSLARSIGNKGWAAATTADTAETFSLSTLQMTDEYDAFLPAWALSIPVVRLMAAITRAIDGLSLFVGLYRLYYNPVSLSYLPRWTRRATVRGVSTNAVAGLHFREPETNKLLLTQYRILCDKFFNSIFILPFQYLKYYNIINI